MTSILLWAMYSSPVKKNLLYSLHIWFSPSCFVRALENALKSTVLIFWLRIRVLTSFWILSVSLLNPESRGASSYVSNLVQCLGVQLLQSQSGLSWNLTKLFKMISSFLNLILGLIWIMLLSYVLRFFKKGDTIHGGTLFREVR